MENETKSELEEYNKIMIEAQQQWAQDKLQAIEEIESDEFLKKFNEIWSEHIPYNVTGLNIFQQLNKYFRDEYRKVSRSQTSLKKALEEAKRMLITIFYVVDTIRDGSTHNEKDAYTRTALKILRKQIDFFDGFSETSSVNNYFEGSWRGSSIVLNHEYQEKIQALENERKGFHVEIKRLKELLLQRNDTEF